MTEATLGTTLRSLRIKADLSQEELATKAQVSRGSIQNWERDRSEPRRAEFRRLATALGVSVEEIRSRAGLENSGSTARIEELADEIQTLRAELAEMRAALAAAQDSNEEREISS